MPAEKTIPVSFRVSPRFKALLAAAADRENRSLTNMLEVLLFAHCEQNGVFYDAPKSNNTRGNAK